MKPIVVQDQVRLPAKRCLSLTVAGISYRLFRSMITVAILALAVAFLSHILSYSLLEQSTKLEAYRRLGEHRLLGQWLTRLREPDSASLILSHLSDGQPQRLQEYRRWSQATQGDLDRALSASTDLLRVHHYFDSLPASAAAVLLGDQEPRQLVESLADPRALETLLDHLSQMHLPPPLPKADEFQDLMIRQQSWLWQLIRRIQTGQQSAIEAVRQATGGATPGQLLAAQRPGLGDVMRSVGFVIQDEELLKLAEQARRLEDFERLRPLIQVPEVRAAICRRLGVEPRSLDVPTIIAWLRSEARAQWLAQVVAPHTGSVTLSAERIHYLASSQQEQERLQAVVGDEVPKLSSGLFDLPARTQWLVLVSFLVCAIGVVNAMMMSVAERFAEIATMKCLGALDGFLLQLFFYEALLQGFLGGVIGVLLGLSLAALRGWVTLGNLVFVGIPWTQLVSSGLLSVVAGVVLAAVAAVGPAWTAARLPPMEAMRVE